MSGTRRGGGDGGDGPPARVVIDDPEGSAPGGPFRSWKALYGTILLWATLWIVLLLVLTLTLTPASVRGGP